MSSGTNVRYIQFFVPQGYRFRRLFACVSLDWKKENGQLIYKAGFSFCHPTDKFIKQIARKAAEERRNRNIETIEATIESADPENHFVTNNDFKLVLNDIMSRARAVYNSLVPSWAMKSFKHNLFKFGLSETGKMRFQYVTE